MRSTTLHYIFDPLCGWCYAVAPLMEAALKVPGVQVELHAGGMLAGPMRRRISADWRDHVMPHDRRIETLSGQPFGDAYFNHLLHDETVWLDSAPPTAAIMAAEELSRLGLRMLHRIQIGHYVEGQTVSEAGVLLTFAQEIGLQDVDFEARYRTWISTRNETHVADTRQLMGRYGVSSFPALLMQQDSLWDTIPIHRYLGRPGLWREVLESATA